MSNNIYCLRDWCCNWRLESDRTSVWRFCLCPTHSSSSTEIFTEYTIYEDYYMQLLHLVKFSSFGKKCVHNYIK